MTQPSAPTTYTALALHGGPQAVSALTGVTEPKIGMEEFLSVARRFGFTPEALERIAQVVSNDDFLGGGPNLARYYTAFPTPPVSEQYEALVRATFDVPYALGVSSGTAALHSAFVGVGVGPGTEVIVPALGFLATSMAVALAGGVPVFCDVDASLQLDPTKIGALISPRTVALAPTHYMSNVCDMDPVMAIARRHNLKVIEDCAQGPGAQYRGRYVGTIGDVGCYSISAYKIIGGGESGLVVTRDERTFDRIRQCAEAGGLWRPDRCAPPRYDGELFVGTNYRMSELEAAVDLVQFGKLGQYCARYRYVSTRVLRQLKRYQEITPQTINDADGYIGYLLRFFPDTSERATAIVEALLAEGIPATHRSPQHAPDWHIARDMSPINLKTGHIPGGSVFDDPRNADCRAHGGYQPGQCPIAEDLFGREVCIPLDQWRSDEDCDAIAYGINKVLSAFCTPDAEGKAWL